jgi:transcriptional regulator with XRE-family HTH domain
MVQALLREAREKAGLRQQDLAERLNVHQSFVSKYESGERRLELLELRRICVALNIELRDFVDALEKRLSELK